jgi:hypothetical protein
LLIRRLTRSPIDLSTHVPRPRRHARASQGR